ncbi:MAG: tetratricopeptide repeat protein [Bryobacterales bacterium]|nr:tetratricopeptide repeat protein [Bryobacterales bacterium]
MRGRITLFALIAAALAPLTAQSSDPAIGPLEQAYRSLHSRDYDLAVDSFRKAVEAAPARGSIRKDLAYTYLKIGRNEAARDQFAEAMRLDPQDHHVALEYAFLCHETGKTAEARRVFDRIRKTGDATTRATAQQAFENIDRPLEEGIQRWRKALEKSPDNFSVHRELAELAERRDELPLAAEHYEKAWRLRPDLRSLLVDLGRVWQSTGRTEAAASALLAASRGAEPMAAERARELLPARYPYVYEFGRALELDPNNVELHRELAYLLLAMDRREEAEREFRAIVQLTPEDLLSTAQLGFLLLARKDSAAALPLLERVLKGPDEELADRVRTALRMPQTLKRRPETPRAKVSLEAKTLAERSLEAGYMKDAVKYLAVAHETDPADFAVMLKLGWAHNILKQDELALGWFDLARRSPEPLVAAEAGRAYGNLRPAQARLRTSVWLFPVYSTRWRDLFSYGQIKTEIRLGKLPLRPYVSTRFVGDTRRTTGDALPQYLSESSIILGVGLATTPWHGAVSWFEAGTAVSYLWARKDQPRIAPDYRGGVSFSRGFGRLLGGEGAGAFFETTADAVFLSRFQNDIIIYSQNRLGVTLPAIASGFQSQLFWNYHVTADAQRQYWANFFESGPGLRFRWQWMPPSLSFTVSALRGAYRIMDGNPRAPVFYDLRVGIWYAYTR